MATPIQLNPAQQSAVDQAHGSMLVLAGAGSGKTRVITRKIAHLIANQGMSPRRIMAVTFTNKAAREMRERVNGEVEATGLKARGLVISTFHSLGLRFIRQELAQLGLRAGFSILDPKDCAIVVKDLLEQKGMDGALEPDLLLQQISHWKSKIIPPEQALEIVDNEVEAFIAELYADYQRLLLAYNAVDFDDLIYLPVWTLENKNQVREKWQAKIGHMLVDEYQDTNLAQYRLIKALLGPTGNFTVVGDDDQSIYAWRGAEPENLLNLQKDYPLLKVVKLEQNYRSSSRILRCANQLIDNNPHLFSKALWSTHEEGEELRVVATRSADDEALRVASEILVTRQRHGARWQDIAILYRGNHQARLFERHLRERNIPYTITGGTSFFERAEVKDVMAYLRLIVNPDDDTALLRIINVPRREIGSTTLEKLAVAARRNRCSLYTAARQPELLASIATRGREAIAKFVGTIDDLMQEAHSRPPGEVAEKLVGVIQYESWLEEVSSDRKVAERRMSFVDELTDWVAALGEKIDEESKEPRSLKDIVNYMSLMDIMERQEEAEEADEVQMMTLHSAKGLEFPHVFLVGMEEELLPHRNSMDDVGIQEERRLAYVGITRAQKTLAMTYARKRQRFGEEYRPEPSRFLYELPLEDLDWPQEQGKNEAKEEQIMDDHLAAMKAMLSGKSL